jgi:nucleotide-binding universal stress UspA family protein
MRVVIAIKPGAKCEWIEAALRLLPSSDRLDIVLVSAAHIPGPPLTSPGRRACGLYWAALGALRTEAEEGAKRTTDVLRQQLAQRASHVAVRVLTSRPANAIVQAATVWGAELILTGSPSCGAFERGFLGSVSADVVRMALCPVLVAGPRIGQIRRVLAATDGSVHAEAALRFLAGLPVLATAEVRVCAITEASSSGWVAPLFARWRQTHAISPHIEQQHRTAFRSLARAQEILARFSCPAQTSLRVGDVRHELTDELERWAPDLLVLGARGRTARPDVTLGSLTEMLLGRAPCPSLVVRA